MKFKRWYGIGAGLFLLLLMLAPVLILQAQEGTPTVLTPTAQAGTLTPKVQAGTPPPGQEIDSNLLVNPGFEGIGKSLHNMLPNPGNWTRDTFNGAQYGEIFTPEGWAAWWEEGDYGRPECKVIPNEPPFNISPVRVHAGYYSTMCFGFYRKIHAGFYQVVRDIPPDSVVEGAFMAHSWSCGEDNPPLSCGDFTAFYFRVGIDPNGDTDPFSENIVWSDIYYNYDKFTRVGPIQATVGVTGVATLFLEATAKWPSKHNDAYWDNARLNIVITGTLPTATPPPPPTSEQFQPLATPQFTPTPPPADSIIHTVEKGDTWLGIATAYGVDVVELFRLNAGTSEANEALAVGQEVVVSAGFGGEAAAPEASSTASAPPTLMVQPHSPAGDKGTICILAFDDVNRDRLWQSERGEMLLADVEITVAEVAGAFTSYRMDGSGPYCFQDLPTGRPYIIRHTSLQGYKTDAAPWALYLSGGQVYHVALAYVRDQAAAPGITPLLGLSLRLSGGIVLLLALVSGVYFVLSRRP